MAGVLALLLIAVTGPIARAVLDGGTADLSANYLRVLAPGLVLHAALSNLRGVVTGLGSTRVVLIATATSVVVDVGLAYGFLALGLGPLGVAASTVLGIAAGLVVLIHDCRRRAADRPVPAWSRLRAGRADLQEVGAIGVPEAAQLTFGFGAGLVVAVLIAPAGTAALATVRAIETLILSLYIITIGVTTAVVTLAAQRIGANDRAALRRAENAGWLLLLPAATVIAVAGAFLAPTLTRLMVDDPRVPDLAAQAAVLAWAQTPLLVAGILGNAVNRAYGDSKIGLIASLVAEYAVFLPAGIVAIRLLDLGISGIMLAHLVYWVAYIAIIAPRRHRRLRR